MLHLLCNGNAMDHGNHKQAVATAVLHCHAAIFALSTI
jgi:hypothetical protein